MASLKIFFGLVPSTQKLEEKEQSLIKEYNNYIEYARSEELLRFSELHELTNSQLFIVKRKEIENSQFVQTPEYKLEQEFKVLSKSKDVLLYLRTLQSKDLAEYLQINDSKQPNDLKILEDKVQSDEFKKRKAYLELSGKKKFEQSQEFRTLQDYQRLKKTSPKTDEAFVQLEKYIKSREFAQAKREIENLKFSNSAEYQTQKEYLRLKNSSQMKHYFKFGASKEFSNYMTLHGSEKMRRFEELKATVQSAEFLSVKSYMNQSPKKKFEASEQYRQLKEYEGLKISEQIKWYQSLAQTKKFDAIKQWELSFADEFDEKELNRSKWITNYYWGEALMKSGYAMKDEKQYFTDNNFEIRNSVLSIITRKEKVEGRVWIPGMGFYPRQFDYSSGLISTGNTFRQKFGRFEAKIRFNGAHPVNHAFWMISDKIVPHIDVAKCDKSISCNYFRGNAGDAKSFKKTSNHFGAGKYSKDFYIYTLLWYPDRMIWQINGVTIGEQLHDVPQEPMYINFTSTLYSEASQTPMPTVFEIDWVRCYKQKSI